MLLPKDNTSLIRKGGFYSYHSLPLNLLSQYITAAKLGVYVCHIISNQSNRIVLSHILIQKHHPPQSYRATNHIGSYIKTTISSWYRGRNHGGRGTKCTPPFCKLLCKVPCCNFQSCPSLLMRVSLEDMCPTFWMLPTSLRLMLHKSHTISYNII